MRRRRVRNERAFIARRCAPVLLLLLGFLVLAPPSRAQINLGPVTIGAGMRTSFEHTEPDHGDSTDKFMLDSVRLYVNGPVTDKIKFMFNTEYDQSTNKVGVLDAVARFEFTPQFNIWAGRFLPPSDRANLYGPYYAHQWGVYTDGVQDGYPFVFQGRDNGVVYWGTFAKKVKVSAGAIAFEGSDLIKCPAEQRARLGIGYVPQGREIFSHLTVEENLRVGLGVRKNGSRTIPNRIFDLFPVLKQMLDRRGGDLSGGQQQQLAIGRALVLEPKLLILDEPTEGIQPNIVHEIGDIVLKLNKEEGLTVLLVEQKLPFARRVASEFCILDKGRRVAAGSIGELTDEVVRAHLSV